MPNESKRRKSARRAKPAPGVVDWRKKRYGRILGEDAERQLSVFREFAREGEELRELLTTKKAVKFWREFAKSPAWGHYYQEPFERLVARFIVLANAGDVVKSIAQHEFPVDHIGELEAHLDQQELPGECPELIGLLFALMGNLDAIGLYSCTVKDFLDRVVSQSCVMSLARAASIDTGVLSLPVSQAVMKALQFQGEHEALAEFLGIVAQGPHKRRIPYQELRWMEYLLREQGAFRKCKNREIFELLATHLKVYGSDADHADAQKAMFELFRKWRKELAQLKVPL